MTRLQQLWADHGQSPWLDNLNRAHLVDGTLARMAADGVRGVTANPTTFANAVAHSADYDEQFSTLINAGASVEDAYWAMVITDTVDALATFRPMSNTSDRTDGLVSIEVSPALAYDTAATIAAARDLHHRIGQPNLLVKIPATAEGIPAIRAMITGGYSVNVTLIFSLARYTQVIDAYLGGLEDLIAAGGDPATVRSVASFFVSRVDSEVDRRLDAAGTVDPELRGRAAVAQAKLAYQIFNERHSGLRWDRLAALGAHRQRPLWASTSTKNPAYPDTLYIDGLIGPDTINTMPEATIARFEDHGTLARTIDVDVDEASALMRRLASVGVDMRAVGLTLEHEGIASFQASVDGVLSLLDAKRHALISG
jgi:transaldolase